MAEPSGAELRSLVDRVAVYELLCKYCDALDLRRWELLEDVFAPDVTTHWPTGLQEPGREEIVVQGRNELVDWMRQIFDDFGPTHYLVSNLVLDVDGDVASMSCRVRAYHSGKDSSSFEESLARLSGTLRRTASGWQIEEFRETKVVALGNVSEFAERAHGG